MAVKREGTAQLLQDAARCNDGPLEIGPGQQQGEFVAAKTRHGVHLSQEPAEPRRNVLEHAIADVVAKRIIDRFEAVEIQDRQSVRFASAMGPEKGLVETVVEQDAIREVGQRIEERRRRDGPQPARA